MDSNDKQEASVFAKLVGDVAVKIKQIARQENRSDANTINTLVREALSHRQSSGASEPDGKPSVRK